MFVEREEIILRIKKKFNILSKPQNYQMIIWLKAWAKDYIDHGSFQILKPHKNRSIRSNLFNCSILFIIYFIIISY